MRIDQNVKSSYLMPVASFPIDVISVLVHIARIEYALDELVMRIPNRGMYFRKSE